MATADLRPMTLGEVLDRTFTLYREHFLLFAGIAALPYLVMLMLNFGLLFLRTTAEQGPANIQSPGLLGGVVLGAFGGLFLLLLMMGVAHAATVSAVSDLYLGRPTNVRDSYGQARGSIFTVIVVIVLSFLASSVAAIFLIIPGIYLFCRLAVAVPAAIVERNTSVGSLERSMELTKGYGWQVFLLLLLVWVIGMVVGGVLQLPGSIFMFTAIATKHQPSIALMAYNYIAQFLSQVLVGPIGTISASLMYYNLRVRKEGFDIQHLMNSLASAPRPLADLPGVQ